MRNADRYRNGFIFRNVLYANKKDCIEKLGLKGYAELDIQIRRANQGKPFVRFADEKSSTGFQSKRKALANILAKHGFWKGATNEEA